MNVSIGHGCPCFQQSKQEQNSRTEKLVVKSKIEQQQSLCQLTQTVHQQPCCFTQTHYPDSEPTNLYFHSLKLHALQRSSKYQFNSLRLDLTRVEPMIPILQVSMLTITPSMRFEQECTINIIPNMSVSQNKRVVCPPLIITVRQQKLKWVFLF